MLYVVAAYTGLRANELATMTPRRVDFDGNPPLLIVKAAYSKRRREDSQPMRPDLAAALRDWLAGRERPAVRIDSQPADEPLWPGKWHDDGAEMLRRDLAAAGIEYRDADGRVFDFHALRHQFISNLAAAGVHPKTAQHLARHSTIGLTMDPLHPPDGTRCRRGPRQAASIADGRGSARGPRHRHRWPGDPGPGPDP